MLVSVVATARASLSAVRIRVTRERIWARVAVSTIAAIIVGSIFGLLGGLVSAALSGLASGVLTFFLAAYFPTSKEKETHEPMK